MKLTDIEEQFLAEKQERQGILQAEIDKIQEKIQPIIEEYHSLQEKADLIYDEMKILARQKAQIVEDTDLCSKQKELSDVAKDVTKLLQKRRK